jgi:hypothetical protein
MVRIHIFFSYKDPVANKLKQGNHQYMGCLSNLL